MKSFNQSIFVLVVATGLCVNVFAQDTAQTKPASGVAVGTHVEITNDGTAGGEASKTKKVMVFKDASGTPAAKADANLADAKLEDAKLADANLTRAWLVHADLTNSNLTGANLTGAKFFGAKLFGANLSGANLTDADLELASLSGANLADADLTGASLELAILPEGLLAPNTRLDAVPWTGTPSGWRAIASPRGARFLPTTQA